MFKFVLASGLVLFLCACSNSQEASVSAEPATVATVAAAGSTWEQDSPDEVTPPRSAAELSADMLDKVLAAPGRGNNARKLDGVRHPMQTLPFFGLQPDMSVIDVEPTGDWYAAILAPLLKDNGTYSAAMVSTLSGQRAATAMKHLRQTFDADPTRYDHARITSFDPHTPNLGTPGSADMVLSFGNVHRWIAQGNAQVVFNAVFDVLKPGGVLGLVDNRAEADSDLAELKGTPYVMQKTVVTLAEQAGFKLDAASNVNANPADGRNSKQAPADADRMTLRFIKPVKPVKPAAAASS